VGKLSSGWHDGQRRHRHTERCFNQLEQNIYVHNKNNHISSVPSSPLTSLNWKQLSTEQTTKHRTEDPVERISSAPFLHHHTDPVLSSWTTLNGFRPKPVWGGTQASLLFLPNMDPGSFTACSVQDYLVAASLRQRVHEGAEEKKMPKDGSFQCEETNQMI